MWWKLSQEFLPEALREEVAAVAALVTVLACAEVKCHPVALQIGLKTKIISQTCQLSVRHVFLRDFVPI